MRLVPTVSLHQAQSGKPVDIDNLPPPVAPSAGGGEGPQTPVASSGGGGGGITQSTMVTQKDIKDDELMAWASGKHYCVTVM